MNISRRGLGLLLPALRAAAQAGPPSKVQSWTVITIGNLSRNRYWGEPDDKAFRAVICTCTLISGDGFRLLVDPSLSDKKDMAKELDRRTGLKPEDVTAIFVTHEHADHFAGIEHFQKAVWYAAGPVAQILNRNPKLTHRLDAAPRTLFGSVDVIATPGHTKSHHSLRFDCGGCSIVIAGDAVATSDFWRDRRCFYNAVDPALGARTMDQLASLGSVIVPGHDNYFPV